MARATAGPLDATRLTRQALRDGAERVVAVGGDGTVGEVVNGFFDGRTAINPAAELAVIELGTGGDFRRTFGLPGTLSGSVERIIHGTTARIDLGRVAFSTPTGTVERYFANIASFGMSADVATRVNAAHRFKQRAGSLAFAWGAGMAALRGQRYHVRFIFNQAVIEDIAVAACAVSNGQYFGGGMQIAPDARPDDGQFDVVIVESVSRLVLLRSLRLAYSGDHVKLPCVRQYRVHSLEVAPLNARREVPLELDGDTPRSRLGARFDIVPGAIAFRR